MSFTKETTLLAPFEIWEVPLGERTIKFFEPLLLTPVPLPDDPDEPSKPGKNNYLLIEYPELNISTFADNRDDLLEFVYSDIRFTWKHIIQADSAKLDRESMQIKRNYLSIAEESHG
jgi:hypothetical protein